MKLAFINRKVEKDSNVGKDAVITKVGKSLNIDLEVIDLERWTILEVKKYILKKIHAKDGEDVNANPDAKYLADDD